MFEIDPQKLDQMRDQQGIRRNVFLAQIKQHPTNYSQWLSGKRKIPRHCYPLIELALKCKLSDLGKDDISSQPPPPQRCIHFSKLNTFSPHLQPIEQLLEDAPPMNIFLPAIPDTDYLVRMDFHFPIRYPLNTFFIVSPQSEICTGQLVIARLNNGHLSIFTYTHPNRQIILRERIGDDAQIYTFNDTENFAFFVWPVLWILQPEIPYEEHTENQLPISAEPSASYTVESETRNHDVAPE